MVTSGADHRIIVWSPTDLKPMHVFAQHRAAVNSIAFRTGTAQLFSASADRTVKVWSLNELAYIETLFGHQDQATDVAALAQERCLTAGGRDRTVRLWKVVDGTQLVFRGGGGGGGGGGSGEKNSRDKSKQANGEGRDKDKDGPRRGFSEGSIDRVAMIDKDTFVSGSDNGSLSLWSVHKKKAVCTVALAHGCDPPPPAPEEAGAPEQVVFDGRTLKRPAEPRWITALATVPYSDLVLSGSWDGRVRAWRVSADRRKLEPAGVLGREHPEAGSEDPTAGGRRRGGAGGAPSAVG